MWEGLNTLQGDHGQANSGPWEATPEQRPHHDTAVPEADDCPAVPDAKPLADVLT